MFHRLARLAVAIALLQICGGHWGLLQAIAWAGMVVNYAQTEESIPAALEKTFDGNHPCALCVAVKEGRGEEKKQEIAKTLVKLEAVLSIRIPVKQPEAEGCEYQIVSESAERLAFPPLSPPPLRA